MKRIFVFATLCACVLSSMARSLSPEEALVLALDCPSMAKLPGASYLRHVHTELSAVSGSAGAYVYDSNNGFVVLAADDRAESIILGYSDEGNFASTEPAPGFLWWLEAIASVDYDNEAQGPNRTVVEGREDIEPMLTTKWGQNAPYNDMCPIINGQRAMTGCVATALAQIMKYHNWPPKGEGEFSYTASNGSFSASANFGATTYKWDKMLDEYDRNSSAEAKQAVAEIMYHVGVASELKYGVDATGGQDLLAALGVYRHLPMSKSMSIQKSVWYFREEWDSLLYEQLQRGNPIYISCVKYPSGHAFVLDGYNNGMYHVNWGWDGYNNGYFNLRALNPKGGEGIQDSSYNGYECNAIFDARTPKENDKILYQVTIDEQYTEIRDRISSPNDEYWYRATEYFEGNNIQIQPAHYSYSLMPTSYRFGLHIFNDEEEHWIPCNKDYFETLDPYTGFGVLKIPASNFPNGDWQAWPAFEVEGEGWHDMHARFNTRYCPLHYIAEDEYVMSPHRDWIAPDSIVFPFDTLQMQVKTKMGFEALIYPLNYRSNTPNCTSSDESIAKPEWTTYGLPYNLISVEANNRGIAIITATLDGRDISASFVVQVVGYDQEINHNRLPDLMSTGTSIELKDTSTSGLLVSYSVLSENECAYLEGNTLYAKSPGEFTLRIEQIGDTIYEPAPTIEQVIRIKDNQSITWEQDFGDITEGDVLELQASASSGLDVEYVLTKGAEFASIEGNMLTASIPGMIELVAKQAGNDTYFSAESVAKQITIKKKIIEAEEIILSETSIELTIDDEFDLEGTVLPSDTTDPTIIWISDDEDVAVVESGAITAVGAGETTITATCGNASATCAVIVRKKCQTIVWEQDFGDITEGDVIELTAEASSGLEVDYAIIDGNLHACLTDNTLAVNQPGKIVIEATQPGNSEYSEAEPKRVQITALAGICDIAFTDLSIILEDGILKIKNKPENITAYIYDLTGKLVIETNSNQITLNTGTYLIVVHNKVFKANIK